MQNNIINRTHLKTLFYFFKGFFIIANCSLQPIPKKSAETAEKHKGIGCFDRVSNGRAFGHPPRWSRGKWFERWRNGRSRLVPTGVGIVIAMHMVSRTIKWNSHSAARESKGEEWDFRVRFNRDTGERGGGRIVLRKQLPRTPYFSRFALLVPSQLPAFASSPSPREFLSPAFHSSIPYSPPLYTSMRRVHRQANAHAFTNVQRVHLYI